MRTNPQLDFHVRYCGARNWRTSLILVLLAVYMSIVLWNHVSSPMSAERDFIVSLFIYPLCALALAWWIVVFTCRRERLVFGLGILAVVSDFAMKVVPRLGEPHAFVFRVISVLALVAAAALSLSLLYSALREGSRRGTNRT